MKNYETILKEAGIELTEEQAATIKTAMAENYKAIADYDKQREKIAALEETLQTTKESLAKFDGVNLEEYQQQIKELNDAIQAKDADLKKKDADYAQQLADRDFSDLIEKNISAKNGRNVKAIKALLDIDALRESKNQQADVEKALAALAEAEDSSMLFGAPAPQNVGTGNPIGAVQKQGTPEATTMASALAEHYKN